MVVDAPNSNGPFQPVALMHFRGMCRDIFLPVLSRGIGERELVLLCSGSISVAW